MVATATATLTDPRVLAAWAAYLKECREAAQPWRYDEVEEWAWAELERKLKLAAVQER